MIIGLTGKNASGKGEVAKVLQEGGFYYLSLSDQLREELKNRGLEVTRENLIHVGREMRLLYGGGVLADRALQKIAIDKNYIVDSIRNPREVEVLRRLKDFKLVHVTAPIEERFLRIQARNREGDPQDLEAFKTLEAREAQSADPNAQQLDETALLADAELENSLSLDELRTRVKELIRQFSSQKKRPDWDEYFMNIAQMVALRSNCMKRKVAAVIVRDRRIISTGYNGTPRGIKNCNEGGCPRCHSFEKSGVSLGECFCSHAEENAIVQAAYHGVSIKGSSIYSTFSPCLICTKMILNSGIAEVIYSSQYEMGVETLRLLEEAGIKVRQLL
ncbi:MAG: AAA family ATPase [Deltaproteobacteria bacterium]|nr:AAA family ATPase [Deltaproteobacteria bacterium]